MGCRPSDRGTRWTQSQAGYTMVMLVVVLAIMSIMMGRAVHIVSKQMQREKEAELIFRGQQYVEAIRIFKTRFGRQPLQLKELWEAKPRVIRKRWKDPITDSENWGLVFVGQDGRPITPPTGGLGGATPTPRPTPTPQPSRSRGQPGGAFGQPGEQRGPIIGVYSTSCDPAMKVWEGRSTYCEWKFVYREQQSSAPPLSGGGGGGGGGGTK